MAYTEAQKLAIYKYRMKNRAKINELANKQYHEKTKANPDFVEKRRAYSQSYYNNKRETEIQGIFNDVLKF